MAASRRSNWCRSAVSGLTSARAWEQAGSDQPGMDAGEEQRDAKTAVGDGVAVGAGDAFDEPVQAEPA